jgi:hypothetical protein
MNLAPTGITKSRFRERQESSENMMRKILMLFCAVLGMLSCMSVHAQAIYRVSSSSTIRISGTSTLSDWVVRSEQVSGEMTFTRPGKHAAGNKLQKGTIINGKTILQVSSIKSEKGDAMDNKMYGALKSDIHPQITFLLTEPISVLQTPVKVSAIGEVEIAGVTRPMTFELDVTYADNAFHLQGSKSLKLTDFEIEPPTAMFGQIVTGDEIEVDLDLHFTP